MMTMGPLRPLLLCMLCALAKAAVPSIELKNAAVKGLQMPAIGLGTGAYGTNFSAGWGAFPECWAEIPNRLDGAGRCGPWVTQAVKDWLALGGARLDSANSYSNELAVADGIAASGVKREDVFILSKVGSTNPMGHYETLFQTDLILKDFKTDYIDLMLVHWPTSTPNQYNGTHSTDPPCMTDAQGYERDEVACRLSVWRAMVNLLEQGKVKSIGASNYNATHIKEIEDAGLPLPSVLQIPFNPYLGRLQKPLVDYATQRNITVLAFSPLAVPDLNKYPMARSPDGTALREPTIVDIAKRHNKSAAQVILRWEFQQQVYANPRSVRVEHMKENMDIYNFELSGEEMKMISDTDQDDCSRDPDFYECFPQWMHYPPHNTPHLLQGSALATTSREQVISI